MQWFSRRPYYALLTSMTIIAAIPLLSSMLLYFGASRTVERQVEEIVISAHMQYQQRIDQVFSDLNRIAIRASANQRIISLPRINRALSTDDRLNIHDVRQDLHEYVRSGPESMSDIYVYASSAEYAVTREAMYDIALLYSRYYSASGIDRAVIDQMHREQTMGKMVSLGNQLLYYRSLPTYSRSGLPELQMVIFLNKNYFQAGFVQTKALHSHFFVIDSDNATLLAGDADLNLSPIDLAQLRQIQSGSIMEINEEQMLFYSTRSKAGDYLVCSLVSQQYMAEQTRTFTRVSAIILGLCFMLAIFAVLLLSRQNYMPINRLQKYIRENYALKKDSEDGGIYAIQETVQDLITQKKLTERQIEEYNQAMGISYLKDLLQGESEGYENEADSRSIYVSWTDKNPFAAVCFYIIASSPENREMEFTEATLEKYKRIIATAGQKILSGSFNWEIAAINGLVVMVLGSKTGSEDIAGFNRQIEEFIAVLDDNYDVSVQAGLSNLHTGMDKLETAYKEAALAIEQCFCHEDTILARFDVCEFKTGFYLRDWIHIDKLLQFTNMISSDRYREALEYLDDLFPEAYLDGILPESEISALQLSSLKYQFLHVYDNLNERCYFLSESRNETIKSILYSRDHRELKAVMHELLLLASEQMPTESSLSEKIINEVKAYIAANYYDNQLSAGNIADHFHVTPNTLSKYFSRKTDTGLLQYIHMIRIGKAHELLRAEPEMTIPEIAERVGYGNTLTFTRAFKTFSQGMTPGKYRKMHPGGISGSK